VLPCQHHSTSAPYSYVIHLVLTVYNLSNCQRHLNISLSRGGGCKGLWRCCQNCRSRGMYVTRYQLNIYVPAVRLKLPAAAIRYYRQDENSPLPYFFSYCFIERCILMSRERDMPGQYYCSWDGRNSPNSKTSMEECWLSSWTPACL
jgi:hypothetical protein